MTQHIDRDEEPSVSALMSDERFHGCTWEDVEEMVETLGSFGLDSREALKSLETDGPLDEAAKP